MNQEPLIIERTFTAPVMKVWAAITDNNAMKQWYFDLPGFRAEVGYAFTFVGNSEECSYTHHCVVTEVVIGKKLSYTWRYEGYEGNSIVTFELFEEGNGTRLKLTHEGLETFPALKDFARSSFEEGWEEFIGKSLMQFLG